MAPRIFCCINIWTCNMSKQRLLVAIFFYQHLNVGTCHENNNNNILNLKMRRWWSKHRWRQLLPSTHPKPLLDSTFHSVTFWLMCCVMSDDSVILHMHLLTVYTWLLFSASSLCRSKYSVLFQKMCNNASYRTPVKTQKKQNSINGKALSHKRWNILSMVGS